MGEERLLRAEVREKINKIVIYTSTVTVQICTVTIANMYIYTTIAGLMLSKFRKYCVNFASLSILYNFVFTDMSALTHTFHITDWEMTITPHDFHCMIGLQFEGVPISLEDELGTWLGAELLGRRYAMETIYYTDLEVDFMHHPQGMAEEFTWMARVFLLYLLGVYLFTNGGQTVSLRWLTLFWDFERVWTANNGQACLAYFYSSLDTLSRGTLH